MGRVLRLAGVLGLVVVLDLVLPRVLNPYYMRVLMLCGISVILAVSLNLINGFTGQFSIGHAGFMAIGAYTSAMFSLHVGQGWVQVLTAASVPPARSATRSAAPCAISAGSPAADSAATQRAPA